MKDWNVGDECVNISEYQGVIRFISGDEACIEIDGHGLDVADLSTLNKPKSTEEQKRDEVLQLVYDCVSFSTGWDECLKRLYDKGMLIHPDDKVVPISKAEFVNKYAVDFSIKGIYHNLVSNNHIKPA